MERIVPSKDVRELMQKEGCVFTDFEKATLIFNGICLYDEKRTLLKELMESTTDYALYEMLRKRIGWEEEDLRSFEEDCKGCVYILNSREFAPEDFYCGVFANAKLAHEAGQRLGQKFCIEKHLIIGLDGAQPRKEKGYSNPYVFDTKDASELVEEYSTTNSEVMRTYYNKDGVLEYYAGGQERDDIEMLDMLFNPRRFENAYIEMPNPFEKGDRVCVVGSDKVGTVATSQQEWADYKVLMNKTEAKDFIDASITVNFSLENGETTHEHINPIFLERVETENVEQEKTVQEKVASVDSIDPDCILEKAISLAVKYHEGQQDKQGKAYILHPLRVMMQLSDSASQMIGVLHDILEDTECDEVILKEEGIPAEVIEGVKFLTRNDEENYFAYIERIGQNGRYAYIKKIDLEDNLREGCPKSLQERYEKALKILRESGV